MATVKVNETLEEVAKLSVAVIVTVRLPTRVPFVGADHDQEPFEFRVTVPMVAERVTTSVAASSQVPEFDAVVPSFTLTEV